MRVKLHDNTVLEITEPTEEHQIEMLQIYDDYEKKQKEESTHKAQLQVIDSQNRLLAKLSNKSVEEVKKMPLVDKNKCLEAIKSRMVALGKADHRMDF